jgi:hypothetical protein
MNSRDILEAKRALDRLIGKQRAALYKPIQVAEILYRVRRSKLSISDVRNNLEAYRNPSKQWRDSVTRLLIDRVSTSSQRYQDDLFNLNAMPPETLAVLAEENHRHPGIVERYIYQCFRERQTIILRLAELLKEATLGTFHLDSFLGEFVREKGIKRSIDKAYEIVVYALFNTLVKHLRVKVTLSADPSQIDLLRAFEEFAHLVLGIDVQKPSIVLDARLYRAGATNAADRGLDMWANFGPVIQVKHLTLTDKLADDVCSEVAADRIVIVCKDSERETIERLLQQLGHRVQAIIVQSQLVQWYEQALRGEFAGRLGSDLLNDLRQEFRNEFPFSLEFDPFYKGRGYDIIPKSSSPFWRTD